MNAWQDFVKPVVVLGGVCLVASALLAFTNSATAPVIAGNAAAAANAARAEVLPAADSFTEVETTADGVTEMYVADNGAGWVITAAGKGYGGDVPAMVAFDAEGTIVGIKFLDNDETPGLGQKVKDAWFGEQFIGRASSTLTLGDIDTIAGATISTSAGLRAVNNAINCFNVEVKGEVIVELTPEDIRAMLLPDAGAITLQSEAIDGVNEWYKGETYGTIYYTEAAGFYSKPLIAAVAFDDAGAIVGVWFDASNETEGLGTTVAENADFLGQFIGKTDASSFDVVAGATVSSNAAAEAVQKAVAAMDPSAAVPEKEPVVEETTEEMLARILPDAGAITLQSEAIEGVTQWYQGETYGVIYYTEATGFYKKPLVAAVAFDDNGAITGVWLDASEETAGVGTIVADDPAFLQQFEGKTEIDSYDAVAGATVSSDAAAAAIQAAVDAYKANA